MNFSSFGINEDRLNIFQVCTLNNNPFVISEVYELSQKQEILEMSYLISHDSILWESH